MSDPLSKPLGDLGLRYTADNLEDVVAHATRKRMGAKEFLEHIVDLEMKDRARRSLERRLEHQTV